MSNATKNFLEKITVQQLIGTVTAIVAFLTMLFSLFSTYANINYEITSIKKQLTTMQEDLANNKIENKQAVKGLELGSQQSAIQQAKIEQHLLSIDTTLNEIKTKLK
jgi:predicted PurR-regulated permease PerM